MGRIENPRVLRVLCWLLHLYTASGALVGVVALDAIFRQKPLEAFLWMLLATFIDSTDGTLARRLEVKRWVPNVDGRRLDDIVDYFTYVVVPVVFLLQMEMLPGAPWIAAAPLVTSGLGFANVAAKTDDSFFLGFPSYWNVVALYLWLLGLGLWFNVVVVVGLSAMVLVPTRYIYPSRTKPLKLLTNLLCILWAVQLGIALFWFDQLPSWWMASSGFFPVYYLGASFWLHWRAPS